MTDPAVTPKPHSASSVDLYLGCPRRWVFERLEGFQEEDTDQKSFGKERHEELQGWIDSGKLPDHILAKYMLALYAKHPFPPTPGLDKAEEHFRMTIAGVAWHGYTDRRREGRHPGHRIVGDWKTTKDLKYALKVDKKTGLLLDPETGDIKTQPVVYATREFVEGASEVTLSWAYGQSKAPWATRLVEGEVVKSACEDAYGALHGKALEMNQLYAIRPKANDVPYRSGYCNAFNKPCAQTERCNRARGVFTLSPLDLDSFEPPKDQDQMNDFLAAIKASAPTVNDDDAPPPPPEDDEAPPPPPEEDDAPPPPPEDEELEAEKLVAEYMAAQRKPKDAPTEVEAGFINAPEAKGKKPYATPEEAAVGEGVFRVDSLPDPVTGDIVQVAVLEGVLPVGEGVAQTTEHTAKEIAFIEAVQAEIRPAACPEAKPTKTRKARAKKADKAANFEATTVTVPDGRSEAAWPAGTKLTLEGGVLTVEEPTVFTADREPELVNLPTVSEFTEEQCIKARAEFAAGQKEEDAEFAVRAIVQSELKACLVEIAQAVIAVLSVKS